MNHAATSSELSESARAAEASTWQGNSSQNSTITQELVERIADKVYAMLIAELKIEQERGRSSFPKPFTEQGGW